MERVWRTLPSDLLEEVLTFLPLASLCRFRSVSKIWNRLIGHPYFASRHARASSPEEYVLISERDAGRDVSHQFSIGIWEVLDVAGKRSFNLSDDFLAEFLIQNVTIGRSLRGRLSRSVRRTILAADGGLLCLSYYIDHGSRCSCDLGTHEALLVCNPVLRTVKQLPHFAGWSETPEWVVMSTDRDSMEYEIRFIVTLAEGTLQPNVVYIYESKAASWRASATAIPGHHNALSGRHNTFSGRHKSCSASVILRDEFYALVFHDDGVRAGLVSYNKATSVVSDLGIDVPCGDAFNYWVTLQLVVSDGRLFCVIMHTRRMCPSVQRSSIEIVEFIIEIVDFVVARREYIHLSGLRGYMSDWFLENIDQATSDNQCDKAFVATGLANSIFLCSFAGRSVAYDLSNRTWHKYPDCDFFRGGTRFVDLFASNLCLSLRPP